jgi:hypothetical protein
MRVAVQALYEIKDVKRGRRAREIAKKALKEMEFE